MLSSSPICLCMWLIGEIMFKLKSWLITALSKNENGRRRHWERLLLSNILPEDKELRMHLHLKKLEHVLDVHEKERNNVDFKHTCFFCRTAFKAVQLFSVGQPANLVYTKDLFYILEDKLNGHICIYCEKASRVRMSGKELRNSDYDKYYMVNYLEFGKSWEQVTKDRDHEDKLAQHWRLRVVEAVVVDSSVF